MLQLGLVRALADRSIEASTVGVTQQLEGRSLGAIRSDEALASRDLDRVLERRRVAPVAFYVRDLAVLEAQRREGIVEAVVLATHNAPSVDPLHLTEAPAEEIEVVDD